MNIPSPFLGERARVRGKSLYIYYWENVHHILKPLIILVALRSGYTDTELSLPDSTILFVREEGTFYTEGDRGDEQIWYMSNKTHWIPKRLTTTKGLKHFPRLSPDGTHVLWSSFQGQKVGQVAVASPPKSSKFSLTLSPDNTKWIYSLYKSDVDHKVEGSRLYMMDFQGKNIKKIRWGCWQ